MKKKGFTLAEMLIVVAIISVLVSIVTVALSNKLESAREAVDLANIKTAFEELTNIALNETAKADLPNYVYCNKNKTTGEITSYVTLVKPTQKKNKWQSKITLINNTYACVSGAYVAANRIEEDYFYKLVYYTSPQPKPSASSVYEDGYTYFAQSDTYADKYSSYCFYRTSEKVVK